MAQTKKDHATDRAIGARVRSARIEKRISQGVLGDQLGISFQQVQKYELGKDRISASQLLNIAKVMEKPVAFFYEDLGDSGDGGPVLADIVDRRGQDRVTTNQNAKIIRALARLPDGPVKGRILSLVQALAPAEVERPEESIALQQAAE